MRNGYHALNSLVAFADIGDVVTIEEADSFSFHVKGPFALYLKDPNKVQFLDSDNLVVKAARALSQITDKALNLQITLEKNLPIAAGIGGGSSDAAATLWGLQDFWGIEHNAAYLPALLKSLGADVPMCFYCRPARVSGIGDIIAPAPDMPEVPIVLANPMQSCPTPDIFLQYNVQKTIEHSYNFPDYFKTIDDLIDALKPCRNDLYLPAQMLIPEIENVINSLDSHPSCILSRMSGSGATCFGLFKTEEDAQKACLSIRKDNPDWWVKTGWINRLERY